MASNKKVVKRFLKTVREVFTDPEDLAVVYLQNCDTPTDVVARAFGAEHATIFLYYEEGMVIEIDGRPYSEDEDDQGAPACSGPCSHCSRLGPFQTQAEIEQDCYSTKVSDR